jgi:hypothetical protein
MFARTKGCPKLFNWSIMKLYYFILPYKCTAGLKWNTSYLQKYGITYNYRDYNTPSKPNMHARCKVEDNAKVDEHC